MVGMEGGFHSPSFFADAVEDSESNDDCQTDGQSDHQYQLDCNDTVYM